MIIKTISNYSFNNNKAFYDQLKTGESEYKISIDRNRYNLVRLDGASFSKQFKLRYASFAKKIPYNPYLATAMQDTALETMKEFPFIIYAYSFSDEISFLIDNSLIDFRKMNTLEKMISILSSFVSSSFNANIIKLTNLSIENFYGEDGKFNNDEYKHYESFIKNALYLLNVAKRNNIPLYTSGLEKSAEIEEVYQSFKLEQGKKIKKDQLINILDLINKEMPFTDSKNHIFYFDARLITFDSESKVYDYFKARQGFAIYKFVEDYALSILEKPINNSSNKTTNMYFKLLSYKKIPISVYNTFSKCIRLGTSFYKKSNTPIQSCAKELNVEDDKELISLISNMLDEDVPVSSNVINRLKDSNEFNSDD